MKQFNKQGLIDCLSIQSYSNKQFRMFAYIIRQLKAIPDVTYYTFNGCIYATKGKATSYPCIVSHMDTVHRITKDLTVLEFDGNLTGFDTIALEQTGIGGDDKVGVFIALECMKDADFMKAVFFRDEEIGCVGSYKADFPFFNDVGFVLQCDRQGTGEFVTNACGVKLSGKKFQRAVRPITERYGYKFGGGGMTDVMALKEQGILPAMANMNCGYYRPHTNREYVNINDVELCLMMVQELIGKLKYDRYEQPYHTYKPNYSLPRALTYNNATKVDTYSGSKWSGKKYRDWKKDDNGANKMDINTRNYTDYYGDWVDVAEAKDKVKPKVCQCCYEEGGDISYVPEWRIDMCDKCITSMADMKH